VLCSYTVATHQLYAQPRLHAVAAVAPAGGGANQLICHDLDGDGAVDMAFSVASGGTAGNQWWIALRHAGGRWRVVHVGNGYKLGISRTGRDVVVEQPVFRKNDANCCPSGGFDHVRWRWNGRTLAAVRRWHTRSP
jgi:hypothetical protein